MHIVLVHGACHGAWCWYKLKPLLECAGHRVSAIDLAASGVDMRRIEELKTFRDYTKPLLEFMANSVGPEEKVVLVGHSLGGMNLALAMEAFPHKITVAVFLTAFMPDTTHQPSYVFEEFNARMPEGSSLDTEFKGFGNPEDSLTSLLFGPQFLALLYDLSPQEDFELGMMLRRPASFFMNDLANASKFTSEGYGQVKRVYVVLKEDKVIAENFQRWMIENGGVDEVKEIKGSDHMAMLCRPQVLCDCLVEISEKAAGLGGPYFKCSI
ncbi:hypothetical protein V2J09_021816 [Rumex salicifolius]